jgi:preprotein translocase subunit SecE
VPLPDSGAEAEVPDNKKTMNVKAEAIGTRKATDTGLLVLAVLFAVAGVAAYYLLPHLAQSWRTLIVVGGIVVGCAVAWFTAPGRGLREFLRETQFEMRKVVWPTRQETLQTSLVVVVVTVAIALVLGAIDIILKTVILDWLLKL